MVDGTLGVGETYEGIWISKGLRVRCLDMT